ncbi:Ribulose-phosphate 3-epimerase [Verticillium dahliae VDG1]|nr:Ribulose-phosphate 3-epimerase [Verticillium dahliae VDG1]
MLGSFVSFNDLGTAAHEVVQSWNQDPEAPRGNFYYGGGGGIQLTNRGPDPTYATALPGSWYWANPTTRLTGTITIDGKPASIDPAQSYALSGDNRNGVSTTASASVWPHSSLHETIPVVPESRASETITSRQPG